MPHYSRLIWTISQVVAEIDEKFGFSWQTILFTVSFQNNGSSISWQSIFFYWIIQKYWTKFEISTLRLVHTSARYENCGEMSYRSELSVFEYISDLTSYYYLKPIITFKFGCTILIFSQISLKALVHFF